MDGFGRGIFERGSVGLDVVHYFRSGQFIFGDFVGCESICGRFFVCVGIIRGLVGGHGLSAA